MRIGIVSFSGSPITSRSQTSSCAERKMLLKRMSLVVLYPGFSCPTCWTQFHQDSIIIISCILLRCQLHPSYLSFLGSRRRTSIVLISLDRNNCPTQPGVRLQSGLPYMYNQLSRTCMHTMIMLGWVHETMFPLEALDAILVVCLSTLLFPSQGAGWSVARPSPHYCYSHY